VRANVISKSINIYNIGIIRFEVANDYDIIISQHGRWESVSFMLQKIGKSERKCRR